MPNKIRWSNLPVHLILLLVALVCLVPFYWMVVTSFKNSEDVFRMPPDLIPHPFNTNNFALVFSMAPMGQAFLNSAEIAIVATVGTVFTSSLAAYAFAKLRFKRRNGIFMTFLATLMIPGQITLIPLYIVFSRLGWIDTFYPLTVPTILLNAYGIFLLRQFMSGVPSEYIEAAKLDGANHFQIYWQIMLPLCKSAVITLALLSFLGNWNNFFGPLIFINSPDKFTVPLIINSFRSTYYVQWELLMPAACVALLPVIVLYLISQRYLTEGIALSGLKG